MAAPQLASRPTLVIGNKALSSWSLRPWLALTVAGVPFDEQLVALDRPGTADRIRVWSPSGRVPCLLDATAGLRVWDSLAICETIDELYAGGSLWPVDRLLRAHARAVAAEMHSGFAALRTHLPMNVCLRDGARGAAALARPEVAADVARIHEIWAAALGASGGPFLFGARFCIADAFFAPVATRFVTYAVPQPPMAQRYIDTLFALPALQRWIADAHRDTGTPPPA